MKLGFICWVHPCIRKHLEQSWNKEEAVLHCGVSSVFCNILKSTQRASLVAQWLRVCLLMQGTRVRALVWEDPTCHGPTRPVSHNC